MQKTSIAILGWGSLIWEDRPAFDSHRGWWCYDGPELPLEFSRVSGTRQGALTLVIDEQHGTLCKVAYSFSDRKNPDDAICDLRCREGTSLGRIGAYFPKDNKKRAKDINESIIKWCHGRDLNAVIWTALPSNFKKCYGKEFCIDEAFKYLNSLPPVGKQKASEYFSNTPDFINTELFSVLRKLKWNEQ